MNTALLTKKQEIVQFDCAHCGIELTFKDMTYIPAKCPGCEMERSHTIGGTRPTRVIKGISWTCCREPSCRAKLRVKDYHTQDKEDWQSYWKGGKRFGKKRSR